MIVQGYYVDIPGHDAGTEPQPCGVESGSSLKHDSLLIHYSPTTIGSPVRARKLKFWNEARMGNEHDEQPWHKIMLFQSFGSETGSIAFGLIVLLVGLVPDSKTLSCTSNHQCNQCKQCFNGQLFSLCDSCARKIIAVAIWRETSRRIASD